MNAAAGALELGRFRELLARRMGLYFEASKNELLTEVFARRVRAATCGPAVYLQRLENELTGSDELRELARELTVGETYFFRHLEQFRAFSEVVLPARLSARSSNRRLRLLSAGCASGEEAYSLAILVRDGCLSQSWKAAIRAVDINPTMLERARRGRYGAWALRETPADVRRRWFRAEGREFQIDPVIHASVTFHERNLAIDDAELWPHGAYDVVFCRNVLMYFAPEMAQGLVKRITRALTPGGYLFLGHAETLRGLSDDYQLWRTHETFYYQRREGLSTPPREQR